MLVKGSRLLVLVLAVAFGMARNNYAADDEAVTDASVVHLKKLLLERLQTVRQFAAATSAAYQTDTVTLDLLILANQELLEAELEMATALELPSTAQDRIDIYKKMIENAKQVEAKVKLLFDRGARGGEADKYYQAKAARLRMEIALQRELLATQRTQRKWTAQLVENGRLSSCCR